MASVGGLTLGQLGDEALRAQRHQVSGELIEPPARGEDLPAPVLPAGASRSTDVDDHVAHLSGVGPSVIPLAVDHPAPADSGAERQHQQMAVAAGSADPRLCQP